jgi:hypothetical protein
MGAAGGAGVGAGRVPAGLRGEVLEPRPAHAFVHPLAVACFEVLVAGAVALEW